MAKQKSSSDTRSFVLKVDRNGEIAKWIANQHNASESIRSLINIAIKNFGTGDYLSKLSQLVVLPESIQLDGSSKANDKPTEIVSKTTQENSQAEPNKHERENATDKNKDEKPKIDNNEIDYDEVAKNELS